jgi:hypothetical protein
MLAAGSRLDFALASSSMSSDGSLPVRSCASSSTARS